MDNIFIERLWRSLKYEAVYLHHLTDGFKAEQVIGEWIGFYNTERPHSSLDGQTPAEAYGAGRPVDMMDKPDGLPLNVCGQVPQAQQQQKDVINRILAASPDTGIHLNCTAKLSNKVGPPQYWRRSTTEKKSRVIRIGANPLVGFEVFHLQIRRITIGHNAVRRLQPLIYIKDRSTKTV